MFAEAGGIRVWYEAIGPVGSSVVVLMHGWGASLETMRGVATCLSAGYRVVLLDFPGFGQSPPPPRPWGVGDYAALVFDLLPHWGATRAAFVGHSFGGRVAIVLAATHPEVIDRLVLVDSAGVPPPRSLRGELLAAVGWAGRVAAALPGLDGPVERLRAAAARRLGSTDYAAAQGTLIETFVRVVNEDLTPLLGHIQASTLLVWGEQDLDTPVADGRLMERLIPDAGLVVFPGAGHYSYLERAGEFCAILRHFLSDPAAAPRAVSAARPAPVPRPHARSGLALRGVLAVGAVLLAAGLAAALYLLIAALIRHAALAALAIAVLLAAVPWVVQAARRSMAFLHVLQLEEYEAARYWSWVRTHPARSLSAAESALCAAVMLACLLGAAAGGSVLLLGPILVVWGAGGAWLAARRSVPPAKKPLVYTRKALLVLALALAIAASMAGLCTAALALVATGTSQPLLVAAAAVAGLWLAVQAAAVWVLAANSLLYPAQAVAKRGIVRRAAARLRGRPDLLVVGISGAYGKTTVKEILAALLEERYRVLKTPASYNTPLGIAGVILRDLRPEHQVFVVEMGSYGPGDVAYLCRLAPPRVGIMTAVGPMHLERFGSVEAIARTDYELIAALPPETGVAVFNAGDAWCRRLAAETRGPRVVRAALQPEPEVDLWATDVQTTQSGLRFTVCDRAGQAVPFAVELLGQHNVGNVLLATAAALACGMTLDEVGRAAARIRPAAHRLQLLRGPGGVTVIDDTYNANPVGVAAGLAVLGEMPGRRKVLVTPGMVELGEQESEEHRRLGHQAAEVCDTVVLVGPRRTRSIVEGLRERGFPPEQTVVVSTAAERDAQVARLVGAGDVVLWANDLPDQYDE